MIQEFLENVKRQKLVEIMPAQSKEFSRELDHKNQLKKMDHALKNLRRYKTENKVENDQMNAFGDPDP